MIDYFIKCLRNYANFSGRARREEYWYFQLAQGIITLILTSVLVYQFIGCLHSRSADNEFSLLIILLVWLVIELALFLPYLAVTVRRLHDINKSGFWLLLFYIPFIVSICIILLLLQPYLAILSLHDINKSGFGLLIRYLPTIGNVWLIILLCKEGTKGDNKYGSDPKQIIEEL